MSWTDTFATRLLILFIATTDPYQRQYILHFRLKWSEGGWIWLFVNSPKYYRTNGWCNCWKNLKNGKRRVSDSNPVWLDLETETNPDVANCLQLFETWRISIIKSARNFDSEILEYKGDLGIQRLTRAWEYYWNIVLLIYGICDTDDPFEPGRASFLRRCAAKLLPFADIWLFHDEINILRLNR